YNDYLSQAGPSFDLVKDGLIEEENTGPHLWNVFSGGTWDAPQNCVEPTGWPHGIHNAQDEAEQHYQRGIGTPIVSDPLDFRAADQLPLDTGARGETNPYPHYYFVRRYSTGGHVLAGAYLDIYHPNAAVAVFVAGRLIYSSGMVDGNECSSDLTEIPAEGATRVLLKPADLARINTYYRYTQHVAVMLRPLRADVESVGFAMRFRAWKRDVAADVPRPWKRGVDHVQSDAGQAICGESDFPVAVDWDRAREYCRWHGGDLPTAAQWEFAARSGGQDIVHPWGNRPRARNIPRHEDLVVCDYANVAADNGRSTCPNPDVRHSVCSFPLGNSDQGVCDLIGNLAEWTLDGRGNVPAGGEGDDRPQHTPQFWDEFADFQLRGGSMTFDDGAHALQAAYRHRDGWIIEDQEAFYDYGFRCAWPNE
ncbi:MAG: SUMF1/EgtB/PvdO family nonheme iron enzyme, partial [Myxococcota bacterium]|nr:SUMF1/EgtB/PvdO family nonheme iron enzyme [Myxococcota bacterium]